MKMSRRPVFLVTFLKPLKLIRIKNKSEKGVQISLLATGARNLATPLPVHVSKGYEMYENEQRNCLFLVTF